MLIWEKENKTDIIYARFSGNLSKFSFQSFIVLNSTSLVDISFCSSISNILLVAKKAQQMGLGFSFLELSAFIFVTHALVKRFKRRLRIR